MASHGQSFNSTSLPGSASEIEAVAKMPAGAVTGETAGMAMVPGPPCVVKTEKAIGEARVDTGFLQQAQPDLESL
jgi:hypothetical protein